MNLHDFLAKKRRGEKITMLTCYDYATANILRKTNIDCLLVGDSVAMTVHGHENTTYATMEMMTMHIAAVKRAKPKQFLVGDMPFMSFQLGLEKGLENAARLITSGANAVKMEGATSRVLQLVQATVEAGIPVMGHIGLTPQSIQGMGGHKIQGRDDSAAEKLYNDAIALQKAGCFAIVLECVPGQLAAAITESLTIPTIGIGAGNQTDGQVLVIHDLLGFDESFNPKFLKKYDNHDNLIQAACNEYHQEVLQQHYPSITEHTY